MTLFKRHGYAAGRAGFTLIELLVVIAIIGILSSVVLASLNSARKKGRDARRVADIKQLQLALELYYDANGAYPATIGTASTSALVSSGYIAAMPTDPTNNNVYQYMPYAATGSATTCSGYHIGASLETVGHSVLNGDADATLPITGLVACTASGAPSADFPGSDASKCAATDAGSTCYDVKS
jgi:type II secretion system protein G